MQNRYILEALQKGVIAAVAASTTDDLTIKMTGRTINPPSSGKWLELIHLPNDEDRTWGDEKLYNGRLRLILHWPVDDRGSYEAIELMESILGYFSKGSSHADEGENVSVRIIENPSYLGHEETAPEQLFMYSVRYQYYDK